MQTFLPYSFFKKSVSCLDYRRLGKQRIEAKQIYNIITGNTKSKAWQNHPAVLMWKGYSLALALYHDCCILEWIKRKYINNMLLLSPKLSNIKMPPWLGNKEFHLSHRSNLYRKNPEWYGKFGWNVPPNLPYIWPTKI